MKQQKDNGRNVTDMNLRHFKTWPICIGISFFVSWDCMKWMNNAGKCWYLCFRMISWCFPWCNPIDSTHLFLWENIAHLSCEVMISVRVQTVCFGVYLWQSLYNLSNTQKHRMRISDSWWPSTNIVFRKQNNTKTPLSEVKMFASRYSETVWRNLLHVSWTSLNKVQFDVTFIMLKWPQKNVFTPPTAFWKCFLGVCAFETQLWQNLRHGNQQHWFLIYGYKQ